MDKSTHRYGVQHELDELRERNCELMLENERLKNRLRYCEEAVEAMRPHVEAYPCSIDGGASTRKSVMSRMVGAR